MCKVAYRVLDTMHDLADVPRMASYALLYCQGRIGVVKALVTLATVTVTIVSRYWKQQPRLLHFVGVSNKFNVVEPGKLSKAWPRGAVATRLWCQSYSASATQKIVTIRTRKPSCGD